MGRLPPPKPCAKEEKIGKVKTNGKARNGSWQDVVCNLSLVWCTLFLAIFELAFRLTLTDFMGVRPHHKQASSDHATVVFSLTRRVKVMSVGLTLSLPRFLNAKFKTSRIYVCKLTM